MIVKAITVPTPRRMKKKMKKYLTKERVVIYSIIGAGIAIITFNSIPVKVIPIGALLYCGIAYEIIDRGVYEPEDPEFIEYLMQTNFNIGLWQNFY